MNLLEQPGATWLPTTSPTRSPTQSPTTHRVAGTTTPSPTSSPTRHEEPVFRGGLTLTRACIYAEMSATRTIDHGMTFASANYVFYSGRNGAYRMQRRTLSGLRRIGPARRRFDTPVTDYRRGVVWHLNGGAWYFPVPANEEITHAALLTNTFADVADDAIDEDDSEWECPMCGEGNTEDECSMCGTGKPD